LLDLVGIEVPDYMQGRSILPLLRKTNSDLRDAFYYSYYREAPFPAPTARAVRTHRYKYIEYERRDPELFDLEQDPREQDNLLGTPEGERLREQLSPRLQALKAAAESS
jgi:arylsulfatase A-like enzyme